MCSNGQNIITLCIKKQYTWKHIMTIKAFILDIGHGLNGNKFINTINVYSPKQKNIHLIRMIEIIESGKKILSHDWI
jgi:hypothetical protein